MGPRNSARHRESEEESVNGAMGFLEHLDELRTRLIRSCAGIASGMVVAYFFVDRLADFVLAPTLRVMPPGTHLQLTKPGEGFAFHLDIALIGGILLSSPYVLYQVWRFIAPGLYSREKRLVLPFVMMGVTGTAAGALFSHYLLFPSIMAFFASFDSPAMKVAFRVEDTFTQYKNMLLAMIAVFQLPTIVFFLARLGLVTARFLWDRIQHAILIMFIAAAVLTPAADPWNQIVLAAPMVLLYVISIVIAWLAAPRQPKSLAGSRQLRLVVAASVLEQARRRSLTSVRGGRA